MTKSCYQWQFQEPKLQVPTIYKAYFSGLREYPNNILPYMVLTYLHSRILKIPHWCYGGIPLSPGPKTPVATRPKQPGLERFFKSSATALASPTPRLGMVGEWWVTDGWLLGFYRFFFDWVKSKNIITTLVVTGEWLPNLLRKPIIVIIICLYVFMIFNSMIGGW